MYSSGNIVNELAVEGFRVRYRRSSLDLGKYREMVSWGKHGFRYMRKMCEELEWCSEKLSLIHI